METLDFKKMCRLCLCKDRPLIKIFSENCSAESLAPRIVACVGIEVEPGENLPDQICNICKDEIERWEKFKKLCECSNEELITGMPPLPDEVLEKNLQRAHSDNLETTSDFGLGDVSLLEHDSLFDSIDGSGEENRDENHFISNKSISNLLNQESECISAFNINEEAKNESKEAEQIEDTRKKWTEKYSRIYMRKYKCEVCDKVYSKFNMLLQHDRIDHNDITMTEKCDKCNRLFISKQRLDTHNQMKHREKIYECDICGLRSVSEKSLKVHQTRHSGRFVCDVCGRAANTKRSLEDHKRTHLGENERPLHVCGMCDRVFKHKQTLSQHLKTHMKYIEWECELCGKQFKSQKLLHQHKSCHSTEALAICEECGAVLKNKTTLYIHRLKHKEKKHTCFICDKMFLTKNLLNRHMLVHCRQSFVCSICKKSFCRNDTLMTHLKTHQNREVFSCDQCEKSFSFEKYLKKHLARVHKKS